MPPGHRPDASREAAITEILRGGIFHTPRNAFSDPTALVAHADGALAVTAGRVSACGPYSEVAAAFPEAAVHDYRPGFILPGLVDTHVHFPQARILGGLGYELLEWLEQLALPEEARLADRGYAASLAREFVDGLASHGTTTALVFGSHFAAATAELFSAAADSGLRIMSGSVLADRHLRSELHQSPDSAYRDARSLIRNFHNTGRLTFAVTPRFALSASEAMLEVCGALLAEDPSLRFTTHINENPHEVTEVARLFPWAADYLAVYEKYNLVGRRSVLAHNVHASAGELARLAGSGASIAHCPASNAALGSGIFPLRRHLEAGVRVALGTDIGAGTGFGILKEGLQAYLLQRIAAEPLTLSPAQLLYLATRAGAEALALEEEIGDFTIGKAADLVVLSPQPNGPLANVLAHTDSPERSLAALFTLGGAECVREARVAGEVIYRREASGGEK